MAKFTPGTVIIMKTTDEPCLVLEVFKPEGKPNFPGLSGEQVTVRRPILSQTGLTYSVDTFYAEEFETQEARRHRAVEEMQERASAIGLPSTTAH